MVSPSTHLATIFVLLAAAQDAVEAHVYRSGRNSFNSWPSAFMTSDVRSSHGPFRPFQSYPRGGGLFTPGAPLSDVFQEVIGDIKRVARELSDPRSDPSSLKTPPHEVIKTNDSVTINVDLPGCKKEDVDAQISEDSGTKTLTISAVRKRTHRESSHANESDPDADSNAESAEVPSMPPSSFTEENFELSFRIGDEIDASGVRGTMEDGVLSLVLPRVAPEPPAEPIDIPIAPPAERQTEKRNPGASHAGEGSASGRGRMNQEDGASTHISLS